MKLPNVATATVGLTDENRVEDGVVWHVQVVVDTDGHLNICIENEDGTEIEEVETTQGDGDGEPLALRFTTRGLEERYLASEEVKN